MAYSLITSGAGVNTVSGLNTTGANLIVVGIVYFEDQEFSETNNTFASYTGLTNRNDGAGTQARIFYKFNPTVGSGHNFTSSSGTSALFVAAYSGAVTSPFDQENGTADSSATTSVSTGSITPTEANELVLSLLGFSGNATSAVADAGDSFTLLHSLTASSGVNYGGGLSHQIQTAATARNHDWTWTTAAAKATAIASFKSASTGTEALIGSALTGSQTTPAVSNTVAL